MNNPCKFLCRVLYSFVSGINLRVEFRGHTRTLGLSFEQTQQLLYQSTCSILYFNRWHIRAHRFQKGTCYCSSVFHFSFPYIKDVENIFMNSLIISAFPLENCLIIFFAYCGISSVNYNSFLVCKVHYRKDYLMGDFQMSSLALGVAPSCC